MRVRVFYHDKCFDGACSASLFTRFHRECIDTETRRTSITAWCIAPGRSFDESEFTGDENAIVDFKYSASPKITWWFDHHLSRVPDARGSRAFPRVPEGSDLRRAQVFRPDYTSCTRFLAHIGSTKFGFDTAPVAELIHWANIVDGALYESPEAAVEMAAPAMKLTLIIESTQDPSLFRA